MLPYYLLYPTCIPFIYPLSKENIQRVISLFLLSCPNTLGTILYMAIKKKEKREDVPTFLKKGKMGSSASNINSENPLHGESAWGKKKKGRRTPIFSKKMLGCKS